MAAHCCSGRCRPWQWTAFVSEVPAGVQWTEVALAMDGMKKTLREIIGYSSAQFSGKRANRVIGVKIRGALALVAGAPRVAGMKPMQDKTATVAELRERVMGFAREREWEQFHSPKNLSMALAAEAGELMEPFLWTDSAGSLAVTRAPDKRAAIEDEIADVVIYALEFANVCGIDLAAAIEAKLAKNAAKYPVEKARGNAKKYTEL